MESLEGYPELKRRVTDREYNKVIDFALDAGLENGFVQEGDTAKESFIPDFSYEGVWEDKKGTGEIDVSELHFWFVWNVNRHSYRWEQ